MTILEKIQKNENQCLDNPGLLSEYLVTLSSHIITAEKDKTMAEIAYAHKWSSVRDNEESDKQADMKMKLEPEYIELRAKEAMSKTLLETIRSAKKRLQFLTLEYNEKLHGQI